MQEQPIPNPEQYPSGQGYSAPSPVGGGYRPPNSSPYFYPPSAPPPAGNGYTPRPVLFASAEEMTEDYDPAIPRMRLAGNPMDWRQYASLYYGRKQTTKWLIVGLVALFLLMGFEALMYSSYYDFDLELPVTRLLLLLALILASIGGTSWKNRGRRKLVDHFSAYTAANTGGIITTVYDDRVEQQSTLQRTVLHFEKLQYFLETPELLVLAGSRRFIVLRADDITQEQAQQLYTRICRCVPPGKRQFAGHFLSRRTTAQELPDISAGVPQVLMQFEVRPGSNERIREAVSLALSRLVLPFGAIAFVMTALFTTLYTLTGIYLMDVLLLVAILWGGSLLLAIPFSRLLSRREEKALRADYPADTIPVTITTAGLTFLEYGEETFLSPAQLRIQPVREGVVLQTPYGRLPILWAEVPDPDLLRGLLFHDRG